ncbi:MAG: HEAT repeat domain-containing protein [Gemmatimonadetes bacterium]|nr:HEAT repeat domain-containing protein [Gemmatimonadota bacterium]
MAQKADAGGEDVLIGAARNDPDGEVREQAVFWLSQVESPKAVAALDLIVQKSTDVELQEKAVFALSQQRGAQARSALRAIAERKGYAPRHPREGHLLAGPVRERRRRVPARAVRAARRRRAQDKGDLRRGPVGLG